VICKPVVESPPPAEFQVLRHAQYEIRKLKEELKTYKMQVKQVISDDILCCFMSVIYILSFLVDKLGR